MSPARSFEQPEPLLASFAASLGVKRGKMQAKNTTTNVAQRSGVIEADRRDRGDARTPRNVLMKTTANRGRNDGRGGIALNPSAYSHRESTNHEAPPTDFDRDHCHAHARNWDRSRRRTIAAPCFVSRRHLADCRGENGPGPCRLRSHVPVPGLASLATPPFANPPGPKVSDRQHVPQKDRHRDAFWYRRTFRLDRPLPAVAVLKVHKAMFGSRVILNGQVLGDHRPSFTPGYFNAKPALKAGENELLIRVGADRDAVGPAVAVGIRLREGAVHSRHFRLGRADPLRNAALHPGSDGPGSRGQERCRVQARLRNEGPDRPRQPSRSSCAEAKSGQRGGPHEDRTGRPSPRGRRRPWTCASPSTRCRLWSPEDPFLYTLEADSGTDRFLTRFGMREFRFDPATGRAVLNGKTVLHARQQLHALSVLRGRGMRGLALAEGLGALAPPARQGDALELPALLHRLPSRGLV